MRNWFTNTGGVGLLWSLLFFFSCDTSSSVDPVFKDYFIRYYGEDGDQEAADMLVAEDGKIFLLGTSYKNQSSRVYFIRTNSIGDEEVKIAFESNENEIAADIERIIAGPDAGNYAVLSNAIKNDVDYLIRIRIVNADGEVLFSFDFNRLSSQYANAITPLRDGGYYIAGKTTDIDQQQANPDLTLDTEDLLLIRFNVQREVVEGGTTRIGRSNGGAAIKVFQNDADSDSLSYVGYSDELQANDNIADQNFIFRRFKSDPASVKTRFSGKPDFNERMAASTLSPGGTWLAAGTQSDINNTFNSQRVYVVSLRSQFQQINRDILLQENRPEVAVNVTPAGSSEFLVLSNVINTANGTRDIVLRKINLNLEYSWPDEKVTFGTPGNDDTGSAVSELPNGDILIAATMDLSNQKKIALIKLRSNGRF